MTTLKIGNKVKVKALDQETIVMSVNSDGVHVDITGENGNRARVFFGHDEVEYIDDGDAAAVEKIDTAGTKTDLATGEKTDTTGGVKDVSGELSQSGTAAANAGTESPQAPVVASTAEPEKAADTGNGSASGTDASTVGDGAGSGAGDGTGGDDTAEQNLAAANSTMTAEGAKEPVKEEENA